MKSLSDAYPLWLCDIWGVVHNGLTCYEAAAHALSRHRKGGGIVILVTNAPRTSRGVISQLNSIGVPPQSYDRVVTSGDVTQALVVEHAKGKVYHLGPPRDLSIFEGQAVERVALKEAHAVLCTGLVNDAVETPDDYADALARMKALNLPMICANPDKMVRKGSRLLYCAGALAEKYSEMGGRVLMAGKPYTPIYQLALQKAAAIAGHEFERSKVLAIGDGPETDIRGAADFGISAILIADGVTDASDGLDATLARVQASVPHAKIAKILHHLVWE
ncbi:MAG TPA: TIGR01459 family HAD-type hydrolase [Aestuariivirga sp.]|nr:TIGR01459 family HAD-type hydrolase [Aestuariivirga sp.]